MCNVQYYDALIDFIGHYLKRDRHKYREWGWRLKKERHELVFRYTVKSL